MTLSERVERGRRNRTMVLKLIAEGLGEKQISERLGIAIATVNYHRQHWNRLLRCSDATAILTRYAVSIGLVPKKFRPQPDYTRD